MRTFSFPVEIEQVLDELGDKQTDFVKEAVIEKARREGLLKTLDNFTEEESQPLSIGDRLRQRKRTFLDGSVDLSERSVRKQIAHSIVDERYQSRQSPQ
jgi:hypothetical protein